MFFYLISNFFKGGSLCMQRWMRRLRKIETLSLGQIELRGPWGVTGKNNNHSHPRDPRDPRG